VISLLPPLQRLELLVSLFLGDMALSQIQGSIDQLGTTEHHVNILLTLEGVTGTRIVDYRTDREVLASIGRRAIVYFKAPPVADLITATDGNVSYNIRLVHHDRSNESRPASIGSVAAQVGASEIVRSQFLNTNQIPIGSAPNVTELIKPNPLVGYSPRLVLVWDSLGTAKASKVQLVIRCVISASGSDLIDFA